MNIGPTLRLLRVYHDLKQKDLATRLGIASSYLSGIEAGTKPASLALLQKYGSVFDLPVSSIVSWAEIGLPHGSGTEHRVAHLTEYMRRRLLSPAVKAFPT